MEDNNDFFDNTEKTDQASDQLLKMLDTYDKKLRTDIVQGTKVTGTITRLGAEYAFVDIGGKNEALIKVNELTGENEISTVKEGDKISAYVISNTLDETILSKSLGSKSAPLSDVQDAMNNGVPVQGKVTGINKGGLNVKVMGHRAFCPLSQIDVKFTEDVNGYLGKTLEFMVTRITEGGRNIVLSRIPLLEQDLDLKLDSLSKAAQDNTVLTGKITRITDFGMFIDLGEVEGLVHISEVSWERASNLEESFSPGQQVEVVVLKVDKKQPLRNSKISLSMKQVLDNPWAMVASRFSTGQTVQGKVTRLTNFGAFVELIAGVEGLLHISEMSWGKRIHHPSEVVQEGNLVNVTILNIDEAKKAVSLSLKDLSEDPWRDVESRFLVGSEVQGTVAKKSKYGYFIDLDQGVTGLLVFSNISPDKKDSFRDGDSINVIVESVDKENRRIALSHGKKEAKHDQREVSEFMQKQTKPSAKHTSTDFGAALLAALKTKNQE